MKDWIRATILMPRDEWQIFQYIVGKQKAFSEDGKLKNATASDFVREFIFSYLSEHPEAINEMLKEARSHGIKNSLRTTLEEMNEKEVEKDE